MDFDELWDVMISKFPDCLIMLYTQNGDIQKLHGANTALGFASYETVHSMVCYEDIPKLFQEMNEVLFYNAEGQFWEVNGHYRLVSQNW